MSDNEHRTLSYVESAARNNSIFSAWTKKWGIHVRPWYAKDKLKFSFVDVGKAGKGDSFDICMDIIKYGSPCFKKWANDILSTNNRFERIMYEELKADEKYPKAYKFITGNKADKTIGICNSSKGGYVINASIVRDGKRIIANVPVDLGDLQIMAEAFRRTYEEREIEIVNIRKKSETHYTDPDASNGRTIKDENVAGTTDNVNAELENKKDRQTDLPNMGDTPVNIPADAMNINKEILPYVLKVTLAELPQKKSDGFIFNGFCKEKGSNIELYAPNEIMRGEQKNKWNKLAGMLKEEKVTIVFNVCDRHGKTVIENIA